MRNRSPRFCSPARANRCARWGGRPSTAVGKALIAPGSCSKVSMQRGVLRVCWASQAAARGVGATALRALWPWAPRPARRLRCNSRASPNSRALPAISRYSVCGGSTLTHDEKRLAQRASQRRRRCSAWKSRGQSCRPGIRPCAAETAMPGLTPCSAVASEVHMTRIRGPTASVTTTASSGSKCGNTSRGNCARCRQSHCLRAAVCGPGRGKCRGDMTCGAGACGVATSCGANKSACAR